jgi:hypothetical protein
MLREAMVCLLVSLPPHYTDAEEAPAKREARMKEIAASVADAVKKVHTADRVELAAAVLVLGWAESRWARYVGEGRCEDGPKGARCDPDRRGVAQARSYWQLHRRACRPLWAAPKGSTKALRAAALCAARHWHGGLKMCAGRCKWGPQAGAFAAYRGAIGPDPCNWPGALARRNLLSVYVNRMRGGGPSALRIKQRESGSGQLALLRPRACRMRRSARRPRRQSSAPALRASRRGARLFLTVPGQSCASGRSCAREAG